MDLFGNSCSTIDPQIRQEQLIFQYQTISSLFLAVYTQGKRMGKKKKEKASQPPDFKTSEFL